MFARIRSITDLVKSLTEAGHLPYTLGHIKTAIERLANVDRIVIFAVPVPCDNPVIGRYQRFDKAPAVYAPRPETVVEVEYADHLDPCWTRFVICKEMCQAVIDHESVRVATPAQLVRLCQSLLLDEESSRSLSFSPPFYSERLAEFAAMEILCPIENRRKIVDKRQAGGNISDGEIAEEFCVPKAKVKYSFDPLTVGLVEELYANEA